MKLIVDAQLPPALARWLRARGHDVEHVFDLGLAGAPDLDLALLAEEQRACLVTKDEDFVALRLPDRFAVIWLRCGNASNRALLAWIEPRWPGVGDLLAAGERMIEVR